MKDYCEEYIKANGVSLWTMAQGSGMPLALCHGGPGDFDYLEPIASMVEDIARVYRYDQRGCGRSQQAPPYDVATFVDDLDALREHYGINMWIAGGHSWGAGLRRKVPGACDRPALPVWDWNLSWLA
jgi:proline iminopeptidase